MSLTAACCMPSGPCAISKTSPPFLENSNLRLVLFGGKGGAGKTTSACATALHLAQVNREKRILVVSTDPAHSVGDSFDVTLGDHLTSIDGLDNLWAWEINAAKLGDEFKREHEAVTKKIFDRGTIFDSEDIDEFYKNTIPGMDEIMAVMELGKILKKSEYDLIILDTAPTGHTLRLLALPKDMEQWVKVLNMMYSKHRFLSRTFAGKYKKDNADEFIETQKQDIARVKYLFANAQATEFVPVTIPEPLSIDETRRLVNRLRKYGITTNTIIINRVAGQNECKFCGSRRKDQESKLREIERSFPGHLLIKMPLFPHQIRGLEGLKEYARILFGGSYEYKPSRRRFSLAKLSSKARSSGLQVIKKDLTFIVIGGKGGVGKTCIASATALRIARDKPDKKILVFSTDPAHSLSDSFDCEIGDKISVVEDMPNLSAYEIDADKLLREWKEDNVETLRAVIDSFLGRGMDIVFDREIMEEMIRCAPPALDEIFALNKIKEFADEGKFDLYVLDTAPTGHLIRFLEMPQIMRDWLKTFFRLLLKYRGVVRLNDVAEGMIETSRKVRYVRNILVDAENTEFIAVTIPEEMAIRETAKLLEGLKRLNIPCRNIIINKVIPPNKCSFCSRISQEQQRYIAQVKKDRRREYRVAQLRLFPHKIKGIEDLTALSNAVYG